MVIVHFFLQILNNEIKVLIRQKKLIHIFDFISNLDLRGKTRILSLIKKTEPFFLSNLSFHFNNVHGHKSSFFKEILNIYFCGRKFFCFTDHRKLNILEKIDAHKIIRRFSTRKFLVSSDLHLFCSKTIQISQIEIKFSTFIEVHRVWFCVQQQSSHRFVYPNEWFSFMECYKLPSIIYTAPYVTASMYVANLLRKHKKNTIWTFDLSLCLFWLLLHCFLCCLTNRSRKLKHKSCWRWHLIFFWTSIRW